MQVFSGIGSIAQTADTGGIAFMAHVGGFIAGVVFAFIIQRNRVA
jgi:membrane associated rhomboid family serine protease